MNNNHKTHAEFVARCGVAVLLCTLFSSLAVGQQAGADSARNRVRIPDVEVRDQNGRKLNLYSDLIKDRIVVVNFFFTTCTSVCPPQARALAKLQKQLGGRLGTEVFFISISKDPERDTVESLKRWAMKYGVGPGWTLVTGEQSVIEKVLWELTGDRPGQGQHYPIVFIGNDQAGVWKSTSGLSSPEITIELIDRIASVTSSRTVP
jgi:protein SCO1